MKEEEEKIAKRNHNTLQNGQVRENEEEIRPNKKSCVMSESHEPKIYNIPSSTFKPRIIDTSKPRPLFKTEGRIKYLHSGEYEFCLQNSFDYLFNHMDPLYTDDPTMKNTGLEEFLYLNLTNFNLTDEIARELSERIGYYKNVFRLSLYLPATFSVSGYEMLFKSLESCPKFSDLNVLIVDRDRDIEPLNKKTQKMDSLCKFVLNSKTLKNFALDAHLFKDITFLTGLIESLGSSVSLKSLYLHNTRLIKDLFNFLYNECIKNPMSFRHLERLHLDSAYIIPDRVRRKDITIEILHKNVVLEDIIMFLRLRPNIKKLSIVDMDIMMFMGEILDKLYELDNIEFLSVDTSWWLYYGGEDLEENRMSFGIHGDKNFDKLLKYINISKNLKGLTIIDDTHELGYYVDKLLKYLCLSPSLEIVVLPGHSDINSDTLDKLFLSNPKIKVISLDPMELRHRAFNLYNTLCMSNTGNFTKNWRGFVLENNPIFAESYDPVNVLFRNPYDVQSPEHYNMNSLYSRSIITDQEKYKEFICFEEGCRIDNEKRTKRTFAETELEPSMVDDGISIYLSIVRKSIFTFLTCLKLKTNEWSVSTRINLRPPPYIKYEILIYYLIANNRYFKKSIIDNDKN